MDRKDGSTSGMKTRMNAGSRPPGQGQGSSRREQEEALRQARAAGTRKDLKGMLAAIHRSRILDGILRRLERRWRSLHPLDLDRILGEVVDEFYAAVSNGRNVRNVGGWLWNAACYMTKAFHESRKREQSFESDRIEDRPEHVPVVEDDEERRRRWRTWCVERALGLVPQLGEENVQAVMNYILGAWQAGHWEVSDKEVAEVLGKNRATVRQWRLRGFRRLIRAAKEAGLVNQQFDLDDLEPDREEDSTDEETDETATEAQ
jgi:hypothetical protein